MGNDYPDFEWENLYGEFDGRGKYVRDQYTGGRSIQDVVWAEKLREDRLRERKPVVRWEWDAVTNPQSLASRLMRGGLCPLEPRAYLRRYGELETWFEREP